MQKTDELVNTLVKAVSDIQNKKAKGYDTQAQVTRVEGNTAYVHIPGGVDETPAQLTINAKKGDQVRVRVAGGTAWLVGNASNPPTDDATANAASAVANTASTMAGEAIESANIAQEAAESAQASAAEAKVSANEAKESAIQANNHANSALTQLGFVEDVVDTLNWITAHGIYVVTSDTEVEEGKYYFETTQVSNPTGNPREQNYFEYNSTTQKYVLSTDTTVTSGKTYYTIEQVTTTITDPTGYLELNSVDEAVASYVQSHLALTDEGLYVVKDNQGYKILLANDGMKVYDSTGALVATYGENITFSATRPQTIGGVNSYIKYLQENGQWKIKIVADDIEFTNGAYVASTEDLDNMEIGGRNLVKHSSNLADFKAENSSLASVTVNADSCSIHRIYETSNYRYGAYYDIEPVEVGAEYTLSFDGTAVESGAYAIGGEGTSSAWAGIVGYKPVETGRNKLTFTVPANATNIRIYFSVSVQDTTLTISNVKLEKGNKATDWTPAPEDTAINTKINVKDIKAENTTHATISVSGESITFTRLTSTSPSWVGGYIDFPCEENEYYTVSAKVVAGANWVIRFGTATVVDSNYSIWSGLGTNNNGAGVGGYYIASNNIATLAGEKYIRVYFSSATHGATWTLTDIKFQKGAVLQQATSYITHINNDGIRVHPASNTNNYAKIDANGMDIYKGGTSVAFYGDTARIGKENGFHLQLYDKYLYFKNGSVFCAHIEKEPDTSTTGWEGVRIGGSSNGGAYVENGNAYVGIRYGINAKSEVNISASSSGGSACSIFLEKNGASRIIKMSATDLTLNDTSLINATINTSISGVTLYKVGAVVTVNIRMTAKEYSSGWNTLFTLPAAYRPPTELNFMAYDNNTNDLTKASCIIRLATDGAVRFYKYAQNVTNNNIYGTITYVRSTL